MSFLLQQLPLKISLVPLLLCFNSRSATMTGLRLVAPVAIVGLTILTHSVSTFVTQHQLLAAVRADDFKAVDFCIPVQDYFVFAFRAVFNYFFFHIKFSFLAGDFSYLNSVIGIAVSVPNDDGIFVTIQNLVASFG
jgi:hypothetical protein